MNVLVRRFLVIAALMFWQGGFVFYASVVVPIGQDELKSHRRQGFITRRVTDYLNLSGAVCLVPLIWDAGVGRDPSAWRRRLRLAACLGMVATLVALFLLHPHLEGLLDLENKDVIDHRAFRTLHRWYLWISTLQWAFAVGYTAFTVWAWRVEDARVNSVALAVPAEIGSEK